MLDPIDDRFRSRPCGVGTALVAAFLSGIAALTWILSARMIAGRGSTSPLIIFELGWVAFGVGAWFGLRRGTWVGYVVALLRMWVTVPAFLIGFLSASLVAINGKPDLAGPLLLLALPAQLAAEVCFIVAGILAWRARRAARRAPWLVVEK